MSKKTSDANYDKTIMLLNESSNEGRELPFTAVAVAPGRQAPRNAPYLAQQTSFDDYTPGLNPLVNAASDLLIEIVSLRTSPEVDLEALRARLEAKVRGFAAQAVASGISEAQVNASQYLLCTALDESVTTSSIPGAQGEWQQKSLLSTFHKDTWGGEVFFDVLSRIMEQPASRLYLLELIYLLLSLGFEGKYRLQDRGPLAIESLRDQIYRQIRLLRGEPAQDLSKKFVERQAGKKFYAYIPPWIIGTVVVICLAVTFWGFSHTLNNKGQPLAASFASHAPAGKPYVAPKAIEAPPAQVENTEATSADTDETPDQANSSAQTSPADKENPANQKSAGQSPPAAAGKTSGNAAATPAKGGRP